MAASTQDKIDAIKKVPLFKGADQNQLQLIAMQADEVQVQPGMSLATQGGKGNELMIVLEGAAEVTRDGKHLADLGAGDFFGEISLLDGGPRTATVTASSPMRTLVIRRENFQSIQETTPGLSEMLVAEVASRLRDLSDFYTN
ncbi:MAG TPA: cyclic nucleotide-binding domain-containing protein [Dehalococcoidia bacterium]|nr:cyclic nucleotide-binding domain-containing protein [Dehalococcoidia bacterium]